MESALGRIEQISVLGRGCEITTGPLRGETGKVTGEMFSEILPRGEQYHIGLTVQTKIARVTLSPKDVVLQGS